MTEYKCMKRLGTLAVMAVVLLGVMTVVAPVKNLQLASAVDTNLEDPHDVKHEAFAPIATSGNNVYIAWWSNKSGNDEIMFRASTDNGKTFGDKINLSNSTDRSVDAEIAADGSSVYVTWWEEVQKGTEETRQPVFRASTDNGKTFGDTFVLTTNNTGGDTGNK
jgi:hypothetical protein